MDFNLWHRRDSNTHNPYPKYGRIPITVILRHFRKHLFLQLLYRLSYLHVILKFAFVWRVGFKPTTHCLSLTLFAVRFLFEQAYGIEPLLPSDEGCATVTLKPHFLLLLQRYTKYLKKPNFLISFLHFG